MEALTMQLERYAPRARHYVIVDIGSPPTGTLSLFNLYIALSQRSGWDTIRLLQDFKDDLFRASHAEDERLENLDKTTKEWYQRF
jgi:hypothetical protein